MLFYRRKDDFLKNREKKLDFIVGAVYTFIIITLIFIAIKYLLKPLLPFIIAFFIAAASQKAVCFISSKTFLSKRAAVSVFTVMLIAAIALIIYGLLYALFGELISLSENLTSENINEKYAEIMKSINRFLDSFGRFDFIRIAAERLNSLFTGADGFLSKIASGTLPYALSALMSFLKFFPGAVIFITFMLISLFYIGYDFDRISDFFLLQMSEKVRRDFEEAKTTFILTVKRIFKAYILLTFITFIQLLCGFAVLKIRYAFILSLIICLVDLFPILGTGTVLVPWSIICFLTSDVKRGAGLLVMYAIITVFRQIAEPKIVGANIGLSPLLSLISMYAGLKTLGFVGIIVFPIITITLISLNERGIIRLYKNPPESKLDKLSKNRTKFLNFKSNDKQ